MVVVALRLLLRTTLVLTLNILRNHLRNRMITWRPATHHVIEARDAYIDKLASMHKPDMYVTHPTREPTVIVRNLLPYTLHLKKCCVKDSDACD